MKLLKNLKLSTFSINILLVCLVIFLAFSIKKYIIHRENFNTQCNAGYVLKDGMVSSDVKEWKCGANCPGGKNLTDDTCQCACVSAAHLVAPTIMSGLKTKFGLDVQPTDIDNAFTKINTKYTTDFKTKLKTELGVDVIDTNTVNTVVGKAQTKYDGLQTNYDDLQTILKNQGFMYRPTPAPTT